MKKWIVPLACIAIASVALYLTFFRPSDEDRIRKVLGELATIVTVKEGDTILSRTARLRSRMKDIVDDDVRVNVSELGVDVRGRIKLADDAARVGLAFQATDCDVSSVSIRIDPAGTMAQVDAIARVTGNRGGERKVDKRSVHFLLRKDGDWKVSTIDVAPPKDD